MVESQFGYNGRLHHGPEERGKGVLPITFRVENDLFRALKEEAARREVSVSYLVRLSLRSLPMLSEEGVIPEALPCKVVLRTMETPEVYFEKMTTNATDVFVAGRMPEGLSLEWDGWHRLINNGARLRFLLSHPDIVRQLRSQGEAPSDIEERLYQSVQSLRRLNEYSMSRDGVVKVGMYGNSNLYYSFARIDIADRLHHFFFGREPDDFPKEIAFIHVSLDDPQKAMLLSANAEGAWKESDRLLWLRWRAPKAPEHHFN